MAETMKDIRNCPYCQAEERGWSDAWGLSPEGWEELKRIHNEEHRNLCLTNPIGLVAIQDAPT
jgi:hypothetical protein